jgi:hypothetical protein
MLPLIAIITLDNVATGPQDAFFPKRSFSLKPSLYLKNLGLEITLVTCTLLASVILVAM